MSRGVIDISNRVHLDHVARWFDSLTGVVHIVGVHERMAGTVTIYTDCRITIAEVANQPGFYSGNTHEPITCIACLGVSNFGTYAPR